MNKDLENIKVGDLVVRSNRYDNVIVKVDRVTKTMIIADRWRFRKSDGFEVGGDSWNLNYISIASEEKIKEINRKKEIKNMCWWLGRFDFSKIPYDDLKKIYDYTREKE